MFLQFHISEELRKTDLFQILERDTNLAIVEHNVKLTYIFKAFVQRFHKHCKALRHSKHIIQSSDKSNNSRGTGMSFTFHSAYLIYSDIHNKEVCQHKL